jgi:signal transduction protein with GAF and PtsI domain
MSLRNIEDELSLLHTIIETVWSSLDLDRVLKTIVHLVLEHTAADSCLIYLFDERTGKLVLSAGSGRLPSRKRKIELELGEGVTGAAAAARKTIAIDREAYADPRFKRVVGLKEHAYEAFLSVPILLKDRLVGVINVRRLEPHTHTREEIRLVETIARLVAGAIENASLYEQTREKARQLDALYRVSRGLVSGTYLDDILHLVVTVTAEVMDSKICSLMLLDEDRGELRIVATQSMSEDYVKKPPLKVESSLLGEAIMTGRPLQVRDVTKEKRYAYRELARRESLKSLLSVPLMNNGKAIGLLNVYTTRERTFTDEEIQTLSSVANQAAAAIVNAQLLERARQLEKDLEARKVIERAKGLLMAQYGLTEADAYEFLRKKSMDMRKSLREVADAVLLASELGKTGR